MGGHYWLLNSISCMVCIKALKAVDVQVCVDDKVGTARSQELLVDSSVEAAYGSVGKLAEESPLNKKKGKKRQLV